MMASGLVLGAVTMLANCLSQFPHFVDEVLPSHLVVIRVHPPPVEAGINGSVPAVAAAGDAVMPVLSGNSEIPSRFIGNPWGALTLTGPSTRQLWRRG